jgi:hypothetical protein
MAGPEDDLTDEERAAVVAALREYARNTATYGVTKAIAQASSEPRRLGCRRDGNRRSTAARTGCALFIGGDHREFASRSQPSEAGALAFDG